MPTKLPQWSDVDRLLRPNTRGDLAVVEEVKAIEQSLVNIFTTRKGERVHRPEIGCNLYYAIGQPMTEKTARLIRSAITDAFGQEPRAQYIRTNIKWNKRKLRAYLTIIWDTPFATEEQKTTLFIDDDGIGVVD